VSRRLSVSSLLILAAFFASSAPAWTVDFFMAVDAPLGIIGLMPNQIVLAGPQGYEVALQLPTGMQLGGLHRRADGVWLLSPARPMTLGGTLVQPGDVVAHDGATFTPVLNGAAAGIPDGTAVDSLFMLGADLVMSFDRPVQIGGTTFGRSDLARYSSGGFSLFWNGAASGVPPGSNVVGADMFGGTLVICFDVPTSIGGIPYRPGQLVQWNGTGFSVISHDPAWPPSIQLRDFFILGSDAPDPGTEDPPFIKQKRPR
jgi:hypothetical protein